MGFSGYEQHICKNGHRYDSHAQCQFEEEEKCPKCGAESAFVKVVDDTNCEQYGVIPEELFPDYSWGVKRILTRKEGKLLETYVKYDHEIEGFVNTYIHNDSRYYPPKYEITHEEVSMCSDVDCVARIKTEPMVKCMISGPLCE